MDKLGAFESFVAAVQSGSLSGAARRRNLSQPAISQQISSLEAHFATSLLRRGRNGVRMTQAGNVLYKHALAMLEEHANMVAGLEMLSDRVMGRLVVTASLGISQHLMSDVIVAMKGTYPELDVVLRADTRILDIESEGIDIAIRSGSVGVGSGVVRKIATMSLLHVATPEYLDFAGRPQSPEDLVSLDYIQFKSGDDQIATELRRAETTIQAPIKVGFTAQYPDLIAKALKGNLGYAKMPEFLVKQDLQQGRLEVVLPDWNIPEFDLFLVVPDKKMHSPNHTAFLGVLLDHLGSVPGIKVPASANQMRPDTRSTA